MPYRARFPVSGKREDRYELAQSQICVGWKNFSG